MPIDEHAVVVMSSGGLRSLVAVGSVRSETPADRIVLLHLSHPGETAAIQREHVRRQARYFEIRRVLELTHPCTQATQAAQASQATQTVSSEAAPADVPDRSSDRAPTAEASDARDFEEVEPFRVALRLTAAYALTLRRQWSRLVYPASFNADVAAIAALTDETLLARQLILASPEAAQTLDPQRTAPWIDTPLAELTDRQIIELGAQLDTPWHLAWDCKVRGAAPCRACAACRRRQKAFVEAGVADPVENMTAVR